MSTDRTARDVDARPLLHPLRHALWLMVWRWHALAQGLSAQGQSVSFAAVSQQAVMTDANEARNEVHFITGFMQFSKLCRASEYHNGIIA